MRITNIDTFSAYLDRLITERIKWYFFQKDGNSELVLHQEEIIEEIKFKLNDLFIEMLSVGSYDFKGEKRTFKFDDIAEQIEELVSNDIRIGEGDRARLTEINSPEPNFDVILHNEKLTRKSNEGRAQNKNKIDTLLKEIY